MFVSKNIIIKILEQLRTGLLDEDNERALNKDLFSLLERHL